MGLGHKYQDRRRDFLHKRDASQRTKDHVARVSGAQQFIFLPREGTSKNDAASAFRIARPGFEFQIHQPPWRLFA